MKNLAVCYWISKVVDYKWNTRVYVTPSFMSRIHKRIHILAKDVPYKN